MNPEEQKDLWRRTEELFDPEGGQYNSLIAAIIVSTDRIVGVLDGVLSRLRAIEDKLANVAGGSAK